MSLLYSADVHEGLKQIEKKIPLIIFPFVVLHQHEGKLMKRNNFLLAVTISSVVATIHCLIVSSIHWLQTSENTFFWYGLTGAIGFHPTYLSLIINILCVWICIEVISKRAGLSLQKKIGMVLLFLYFAVLMILLSSKIQLMIFLIITIISICFYAKQNLNWKLMTLVAALGLMMVAVLTIDKMKERFLHINTYHYQLNAPVETFNELTVRLALFECSSILIRQNPVFGTGIGDVMSDLDHVYREVDYKFGYLDHQDPHNQYLRVILGTGSVGLLLLVASFVIPFWLGVRSKDYLLMAFLLIFSVSFLFESVLERHNGIVIFSILNAILILRPEGRVNF